MGHYLGRHWRETANPDLDQDKEWFLTVTYRLPMDDQVSDRQFWTIDIALEEMDREYPYMRRPWSIVDKLPKYYVAFRGMCVLRDLIETAEADMESAFASASLSDLYPRIPRVLYYIDVAEQESIMAADPTNPDYLPF